MKKLVSLLVLTLLGAGFLLGVAAPSDGSVAAKTSKLCTALKGFDVKALGTPISAATAEGTLRTLRKAKRVADGQAKVALGVIVAAYEHVADGKRAAKVLGRRQVYEALSQLSVATSFCGIDLPDIVVPSIALPTTTRPGR